MALPKTREEENPYPRDSYEWRIWNDGYARGQSSIKRRTVAFVMDLDSDPHVQAFARHRIEATRQLEADKAELVEAVKLAANRFDVCIVNAIADGRHRETNHLQDWRDEARAIAAKHGGKQ